MQFKVFMLLLMLAAASIALAHDEPFIVCDVTVIDTAGKPVAGAEVLAFYANWDRSKGELAYEKAAEAIADFSGQAHLQWPTTEKDYFVFAYKPGLSLGWSLIRSWKPRHKIALQLGKVVPLSGTVVDQDGKSVTDAVVQCNPNSSSEFNFNCFTFDLDMPLLKTRTDTEGKFVFNILSDDMTTDFFVTHPNFAPHFTNAQSKAHNHSFRPGQEGIVVTLSKGCTLRGKVIGEDGKGLSGVPIHAELNDRSHVYRDMFTAVSDKKGHFMMTNMPEETYLITTGKGVLDEQSQWPSFGTFVRTHPDRPATAAVKIEKGFPVEFVVLEEKTKRLLPGASVNLYCSIKSGSNFRSVRISGKTDGSGRVTLPCFLEKTSVSVWTKGYNGMWPTPAKINKSTKRIPIFLTPEVSVTGRVVDAEGKPAAGIWVYPVPAMEKAHDITDDSGRFALQFQPMSEQMYLLAQDIEQNLCALVEITKDRTDYTLRLQKGLILKGKIVNKEGQPIRGAMVRHRCLFPGAIVSLGESTLSDKNGEYCFCAVPPTQDKMKYSFEAFAAGYGSGELKKIKVTDETDTFALPDMKLRATDCSVAGIVVDEKGNPVPNIYVGLSGSRGSRTANQQHYSHATDSQGRFFFSNICREPLSIQAGWASDKHGSLQAFGGDQNLRVVLNKRLVHPEHWPMVGRAIPPLCFDGKKTVDPNQLEGKQVVVCFWDMEEKTQKQACAFAQQLDALSTNQVSAHFVSIYPLRDDAKKNIPKKIHWPIYDSVSWTEMDLIQRKWGAQETPWFIVTDKQHIIRYEGTSPDEAMAAL